MKGINKLIFGLLLAVIVCFTFNVEAKAVSSITIDDTYDQTERLIKCTIADIATETEVNIGVNESPGTTYTFTYSDSKWSASLPDGVEISSESGYSTVILLFKESALFGAVKEGTGKQASIYVASGSATPDPASKILEAVCPKIEIDSEGNPSYITASRVDKYKDSGWLVNQKIDGEAVKYSFEISPADSYPNAFEGDHFRTNWTINGQPVTDKKLLIEADIEVDWQNPTTKVKYEYDAIESITIGTYGLQLAGKASNAKTITNIKSKFTSEYGETTWTVSDSTSGLTVEKVAPASLWALTNSSSEYSDVVSVSGNNVTITPKADTKKGVYNLAVRGANLQIPDGKTESITIASDITILDSAEKITLSPSPVKMAVKESVDYTIDVPGSVDRKDMTVSPTSSDYYSKSMSSAHEVITITGKKVTPTGSPATISFSIPKAFDTVDEIALTSGDIEVTVTEEGSVTVSEGILTAGYNMPVSMFATPANATVTGDSSYFTTKTESEKTKIYSTGKVGTAENVTVSSSGKSETTSITFYPETTITSSNGALTIYVPTAANTGEYATYITSTKGAVVSAVCGGNTYYYNGSSWTESEADCKISTRTSGKLYKEINISAKNMQSLAKLINKNGSVGDTVVIEAYPYGTKYGSSSSSSSSNSSSNSETENEDVGDVITLRLFKITLDHSGNANYTIDSTSYNKTTNETYYAIENVPVTITSVAAKSGSTFSKWEGGESSTAEIEDYKVASNKTLKAIYNTSSSSSSSSSSSKSSSSSSNTAGGGSAGSRGDYDDVPRTGESKADIWILWSVLLIAILGAGFMIYKRFGLVHAIASGDAIDTPQTSAEVEILEKEAKEKEREDNLQMLKDLRDLK